MAAGAFFFLFLSFSFRISYANEGKSSSSSSNNIVYNEGAILVATYDDNLATYCAASIKNSFGYESEWNRLVYIYAPGSYPITLAVSPRWKKARGILLS